MRLSRVPWIAVLGLNLFLALGCVPDSGSPPPAPQPLILQPPVAQSVFEGMTAAFRVTVEETGTLTYQWLRDGVPVPGATQPTWTTGPLQAMDNGARISVVVNNAGTRLTSAAVNLTVRPPLDLRFKGIGEDIPASELFGSNLLSGSLSYADPGFCSPLAIGGATQAAASCTWFYFAWGLAPGYSGLSAKNGALYLARLEADLQNLLKVYEANCVFTSLDIGEASGVWAFSLVKSQNPELFTPFVRSSVPLAQLQAYAAAEGAQGRVITALSFWSGGHPYVMSYGWSRAPNRRFEAQVARATLETLVSTAQGLSDQGYVLTAVGVDNANGQGFVLVGTRAEGATQPREFQVQERPVIGQGWINAAQTWDSVNRKWIVLVQR